MIMKVIIIGLGKIGFLYEFLPSEGFGDPFLVFGDKDFDVSKIGFEFCDNSA